jgi:glycosyltransferase involved in cell wall biosynthesis
MQVDVVLLTKNSEHLLCNCLTSIYQNVPVRNLIVIDGFSTDRTLQILEKFNRKYGNVSLVQMDGSRAKARTEGIRRVGTDWFMFVDSDVLLCRDWFKKAQADLAHGVGAVWGLNIDVLPNVKDKRVLKLQSIVARQ